MKNPAPTLSQATTAIVSVLTANLAPVERELDGVAEALARVAEEVVGDALSEADTEDEAKTASVAVDAYCNVLVSVICDVDGVEEVSLAFEEEGEDADAEVEADGDNTDNEASKEALTTTVSVLDTPSLCAIATLDSTADT